MFSTILDLLICISENIKKTYFLTGGGGGSQNVTVRNLKVFFYAFPSPQTARCMGSPVGPQQEILENLIQAVQPISAQYYQTANNPSPSPPFPSEIHKYIILKTNQIILKTFNYIIIEGLQYSYGSVTLCLVH